MEALAAGFWGFVGGVSLLIGAVIGLYAGSSQRAITVAPGTGRVTTLGFVLAFSLSRL